MGTFGQGMRLAARQLWRDPGFTITVILTLALSIGANTAIFSVVNALLLKHLPYFRPERMGTIYVRTTGSGAGDERSGIDGEKWEMLRDNVPALLSAVSSPVTSGINAKANAHVQYLHLGRISAHYFDVLALRPMIGRNFSEDEDRPNGPHVAILSYRLWRGTFDANPNVLGQAISLKGEPYTIIGVLPENAITPLDADIFTPLQASRHGEGEGTNFQAITRLRDGATWEQADFQINRAWAARAQAFAKSNPGSQVYYYSVPLQHGLTDTLRPQVLVLMIAASFILLIACANLAGLSLVRMWRRTSEFATRLALGASHWQIQRQLWFENLLLSLVGGAAGLGTGFLALRGILTLLPDHFLPVPSVPLDVRVLAFTLTVSLLTSILFGMLPALMTRKVDLRSSIASRGVISSGSLRLRQGLIATEVALTVVLLAASGLLIRTLAYLQTLPPGFNPAGVMTAKASLDVAKYHDPAAFRQLLDASIAAMRQIPGVRNAAVGLTLPYERALNDGVTLTDGKMAGQQVGTDEVYVTPAYFETLQIPLLAGRSFTRADGPTTQQVIVVNQTFARKFFPGESPIGRYVDNKIVIGVVADTVLSSGLTEGAAPLTSEETIYFPATQVDAKLLALVHTWYQPSWIVRVDGRIYGVTSQMQRSLSSVDVDLPFSGFYTMQNLMAATLSTQRIEVALLTAMATLALMLSALGIFALVANTLAQRSREIGIRLALGSTVTKAIFHIGRSGAIASVVGLVVGLILCVGALGTIRSALYGVGVYDGATIVGVVLTLFAATLLAIVVPGLRVARIDPGKILREE